MNTKLLEMHPSEYLCPHCGEWHKLPKQVQLNKLPYQLHCIHKQNQNNFSINFGEKICSFSILVNDCTNTLPSYHTGAIKVSDIVEQVDISSPNDDELSERKVSIIVKFSTIVITKDYLNPMLCDGCRFSKHCFLLKNVHEYDGKFFEVNIAFKFTDEKECEEYYWNS